MNFQNLIEAEIKQRDDLKRLVMVHVLSRCNIGSGYVKRGVIHQHVYESMGFHGKYGNQFSRFVNKVLAENGFRISYSSGQRVVYGLQLKEETCPEVNLDHGTVIPAEQPI